jgi:hypothetical protein
MDLQTGHYTYRLNQIDFDGSSNYSEEVMVEVTPSEYFLEQNYPNPFNPSTKIKFNTKEDGLVRLTIYDVLGNEVQTVLNEFRQAGSYEVNFDAGNLPSGLYLAKLHTANYSETIKMSLIK